MIQVRSTSSTGVGIFLLAASLCISLATHDPSLVRAAQDNAIAADVQKIAASIKNGNNAEAQKQAVAVAAKIDLEDAMHVFKPRKKGGVGVGAGGIVPDGVEQMIIALERGQFGGPAIVKESAALEDMAHLIAATSYVTEVKLPDKSAGKNKEDWLEWSARMRAGAAELARASKAKQPQDVIAAAVKISSACNSCHCAFHRGAGINAAVLKIAEAIKKGDDISAKKQAKALAKLGNIGDFMAVVKTRKECGVGVGKVAGAIDHDGVEAKLNALSKAAPGAAAVARQAGDLEEMSYVVAAVAEVARVKLPEKIKPAEKKVWLDLAADARTGADAFAKAAKAKNPKDLQAAANQITAACNSCHTKFK